MSSWHEPKLEDLSITPDGKELYAYIGSDDFGAIYTSIKIKDIKEIMKLRNRISKEDNQLKLFE